MKKILVVDNHPVVLKLLVDFLNKEGHEVITADDGLEALEVMRGFTPDIVFTDLVMPNISGEKLCQVIRSKPEFKNVRIIIYSATVLEDEKNITNIGADACIAKGPFKNTEAHLLTVIEHVDNGTISEITGKILGGEELFKRHITSELLFSKRHYEIIFDCMPEGVIEFTFDYKIFHANTAAVELCGLPEENLLASRYIDLFSGNERERLQSMLANISEQPAIIDENQPILLNGKQVSISFLPIKDEEHEFIVAIMRDLTEKKGTEKELDQLRHQQQRILNAVGEGIFGLDRDGVITFANPAAIRMLGCEQSDLVGHNLHQVAHCKNEAGEHFAEKDCPISAAIRDGIARKGTEVFWRKDNTSFPIRYTSTPIEEDYEIQGAVVTFSDITERKKWEEKLHRAVITDDLTGLFNRRGFMTMADTLIKISARDKIDLLLVYVDFDNMKWINDTFGHLVGDQALIETATMLRDTFRLADVIGRIGGDEFVILCTDKSPMGSEETIAQRLIDNLDRINSQHNRQYPLSVSFGIARYNQDSACSIDELLSRADTAMYQNKESKKHRRPD